MKPHIVPLATVTNEQAIRMLEEALDRAKKGELRELAMISLYNAHWTSNFTASENRFEMIGAISLLQHRVLKAHIEENDG